MIFHFNYDDVPIIKESKDFFNELEPAVFQLYTLLVNYHNV